MASKRKKKVKAESQSAQAHQLERAQLDDQLSKETDAGKLAVLHLQLGHLLRGQFLEGVNALKHFQEAFKLDPERLDAVGAARSVYRELGRLPLVQKLLNIEISSVEDVSQAGELYKELGDVLVDQGDAENAALAYAEALKGGAVVSERLEDVQVTDDTWQERMADLVKEASSFKPSEAAELLVRAAGIVRRFDVAEGAALLERAYRLDPHNERVASLFEGLHIESERAEELLEIQESLIQEASDPVALLLLFGGRWAQRHLPEAACPLLRRALSSGPVPTSTVTFLLVQGQEDPAVRKGLVQLAKGATPESQGAETLSYLLASAALVALRDLNNMQQAKDLFDRLLAVAPSHPALLEFREHEAAGSVPSTSSESIQESNQMDETSNDAAEVEEAAEGAAQETAADEAAADEAVAPEAQEAAPVDEALVADLREKLVAAEKRPHEYVKILTDLGDALGDPEEKAEKYREAAEIYAGKGNAAEAVKAYEALLSVIPSDEAAKAYLRETYEKRRDWEKLISLLQTDAEALDPGPARTDAYREIAQLATDRIKKPEICVGLWDVVLREDPQDAAALSALVQLHERGRNYEELCDVLEKVVEVTYDESERIGYLTKLGQIAGDRLKDDARAAEAYRQLLTMQPDDRRAQEQLKKRYVALGRWDELEMFFAESENWDEFIRLLESNESKAETQEQRLAMLHKVAELWITQKGKADRAARSLEKILSVDEQNLEAAERLIPIYEEAGNPKGLVKAIEVKLGHVEDPSERLGLLTQVAELYEEKLRDKKSALSHLLEAVALDPSSEQNLDAAERVAGASKAWEDLVTAYQNAADQADDDAQVSLRLRLGRILSQELDNVEDALAQYRAVYDEHPDNTQALTALEGLYQQTEGWTELLEVYRKKLSLVSDPEERKATQYGIAKVQRERMEDVAGAISTYEDVLQEDADDLTALAALDDLYAETKAWDKQAETLMQRVERAESDEQLVELKFRLADVQEKKLGDAPTALNNYREVLLLNMDHSGARVALEALLTHDDLKGEAAIILETVFETREDWEKLVGVLEVRAEVCENSEEKVELLRKLATISSTRLGSAEDAISAQARALRADPSNTEARIELEDFAEQSAALPKLAQIYRSIAEESSDDALSLDYWTRLASLQERLGDVDAAAVAYDKALKIDPANGDVLVSMDTLFRGAERWEDLVGVYRKRIEIGADPQEMEVAYAEMAEVLEVQLERPEDAVSAYQEILAEMPASLRALSALDQLFSKLERWEDLASNLEAQLALAESAEASQELTLRLAALREQKMNQVETAIDGYREVLDADPTNSDALGALERLSSNPEHELNIAEILEPLYRNSGNYQKLIGVHEVQVRRSEDPTRQVELLEAIAELQEDAAGDVHSAFDTTARALACEPANDRILETLKRLAAATEQFEKLAQILSSQAALLDEEPELASSLLMNAARIYEDSVGDTAKAIEFYGRVLQADGTRLEAAEALQRLYQVTEQYAQMSAILQQKAEILEDIDSKKEALYQAAKLEEDILERPDAAIAAYEKVLEIDGEDTRSVDALINLLLGLSRWEELLSVYTRKVDLVLDPEEKKQVLYEVGAVYERELSNVESAIDTYQRILELDPDDLTALGRLDVLYQTAENWQELLSILTREAELTADPEESVGFQYRVAALYEKRLEDVERAVDLYRELLVIQPDHGPTLDALETLQRGDGAPLAASAVLEQVYESQGDAEKLIGALEVQVKHAEDAYAGVETLQRIATLQEESLGAVEAAFETYSRAVALDSQNVDVLESFERLALLTENWKKAAEIYDTQLAAAADEPERQVDLGLRAAQVYEVQLEDVQSAIARYRTVLGAEPENRSALVALDRLYQQTENYAQLATVLAREAEIGETPEDILEFKYRLGQLRQSQLDDIPGAIDAYREVLAAAPEHEASLEALETLFEAEIEQIQIGEILEPIYQAGAEWEKLLNVREGQLSKLVDAEERIAMYQRMAEEAEEKLVDGERAFQILVRALMEAPRNERTVEELSRLAPLVDEGWESLANAYADVLAQEGSSPEVIAETGHRLATVFEEELADVSKAEETYRFVLSAVPGDLVTLENLDRIYTSLEQWVDLAPILERRAQAVEDTFDKVELYLRLGRTYEEKLAPAGANQVSTIALNAGAAEIVEAAPEALEEADDEFEEFAEAEPSLDDLIPEAGPDEETVEAQVGDLMEEGPTEEPEEDFLEEEAPSIIEAVEEPSGAREFNRDRLDDAIRAYRVVFDELQKDNEEAIEALCRLYRLTERWEQLDIVFQRELENASGDADEADVRAKRAHLAADHLGKIDESIEGWKRVLDLRGEDPEALRALAFLYEKQQQWSELTDVLERHFDIADTDEDRVHVLTMRARLFDEQLNRDEEALETYQRVLDIDYSNATALRAIASIWRRRKSVDELVNALVNLVEQGASQFGADELVASFRELAKLYQDELDQPFEAIDSWRKLLDVGPGDFEALDRLEGLYSANEEWVDIVDVKMQRAAALPEPEEQVREYLEVTDIWKSHLREYDKAVEAYDKVLDIDPLHDRAFKELERLHTNAERWEPLIELYLNRLEHYEDVPARSDLLRRIARVFDEKLGDQDQAFDALVTAFADDFFDDETSSYLEKISQSTGRWSELITSSNTWLKEEQDRKKKIQLALRLGKWYGEDLGRPTDAQAYYGMVLEIDPNNTRVMRQMAAIERLSGNYPKAGQMLNKALEVAVSNDDRKVILGDLGELLHRHMDQPDQAIPYYKRALEVDGGYMPALVALERIYEDRGQIQELIEILTKKAGAIERPEDAIKQKLRLGELLEERMKDPEGAAKAYREALAFDDMALDALRGLERVLPELEGWTELVTVLEKELDVVDIEKDRVALLLRLAQVQEEQFLKADIAASRLEQALEIDPTRLEAYVSLARCYRRLKQWNDLIETMRRHLEETTARDTKLELFANIGAVYRDELGDLDQAIDAYQEVVDADETNISALDALSKLFEKQGEAARAIEMMTRVAELTADGGQQVDMYYRIGRAMEEKLSDRYGAREKFEMALDLDPTHIQSLTALRTIAVDEADWDGACRYLEQEQKQTESARQRARLLVELGKIRDEMLGEHEMAIAAYEQAIELDSDCEEAALPLADEYAGQDRWQDAAPLAEMLVRRSKNRDKHEQQALQKRLGVVMTKIGAHDKALAAYQAAHQLDLTDSETIRGVADSAFNLEDWPTALTNYQKVLTSLGEEEVEARTDVYFRLGEIKKAQGQDRQAINNYEKALALDGEHRPSLEALVSAYEKVNDFKQVTEYKRQILDGIFEGDERFDMLMEIGDIWAGKVKEPLKALEAYEEARDLKPTDHILLHKMLQNYQAAEEWQKMVDILDAIQDLEERPAVKAKLYNTQAQIYRDKLDDIDRAVELFNEALDQDAEFLEAFERINKVLTAQRNWKQLERSYRKMLHRLAGKGKAELEHNLWHQLGLIYRDRTGQTNEAIEAFRMSASLVPEAPVQRQILAELYESTEQWNDAIKEQRRILRSDPLAIEPYLALYRLQLHKQAYDDAWCVASAISFMGKADAETDRFFQDYRPQGMLPVTGRLGNEHWLKALVHEDENLHISKIFEMIAPAALQAKLALLKSQGKLIRPDERFRQDPATSTITFAKTFGWAAQVLGINPPVLYVRNDVPGYLQAVPNDPPSSVAGQTVLSGFQPQELTFICGKHLSSYRPEHYLQVLFPTRDELTIMLFAGVLLAAPQQPMPPGQEGSIRQAAQQLGQFIQPAQLEGLRQVVKQFLAAGAKANVKRWNQAVELTACRAGLILCGDLDIAKKIIAQEGQTPGGLSPQDKIKDLLVFAVSIEYCALRKALGVAIQT